MKWLRSLYLRWRERKMNRLLRLLQREENFVVTAQKKTIASKDEEIAILRSQQAITNDENSWLIMRDMRHREMVQLDIAAYARATAETQIPRSMQQH